ncbi:MAG: hypothetical protein E7329_02375 [Clostridiales bacterium]|nr:hypothetical protein [Clostridiales bacterium]
MLCIRPAAFAAVPVGDIVSRRFTGTLPENVDCVTGGWVQGRPSLVGWRGEAPMVPPNMACGMD